MPTNDEIIDKEDERLGREKEEHNLFSYQSINKMLDKARAEGYKEGQSDTIKKLEELAEDIYGKYIGEEHIEKTKGRWLGVIECIILLKGKCTIQDRIELPEEMDNHEV